MIIHKGEQYAIPFVVKAGEESVSPANASGVRIAIETRTCSWPDGELAYDTEEGVWLYPLTEEQSTSLFPGDRRAQVAVKFDDDIVMSDVIRITVKDSIIKRRWPS